MPFPANESPVAAMWTVVLGLVIACTNTSRASADEASETANASGRTDVVGQIDQLISAATVGPMAALCNDQDFIRRIYLDLCGIVPTIEQTREFLASTDPQKRVVLIDRLLATPDSARHMSYTFDTFLLERRPDKGISRSDWHEYLFQSFLRRKPYDQLVREILAADGAPGDNRVRAKFQLDRDCDANGLVRDVGRLFLGRDLQCAQCHDHPLVDDYYQDEYYGLLALLQRSYLFTDKQQGDMLLVGEKADGLPEFRSVFLPDKPQRIAVAYVPGRPPLDLPLPPVGQEYVVAPADTARAVPRYSLRHELASDVTINNPEFDTAIVNRLWSHLFGVGIVDPVDMLHGDNPPSHPQLLQLLADSFKSLEYDIAALLRIITQTQAYQRAIDPPTIDSISADVPQITATRVVAEQAFATFTTQRAECEETLGQARTQRTEAETVVDGLLRSVLDQRNNAAKQTTELTKLQAELQTLSKTVADVQPKAQLVAEALAKAEAALQAIPDDPQLKTACDALEAKSQAFTQQLSETQMKVEASTEQIAKLEQARQSLLAELAESQRLLAEAYQPLKAAHATWLSAQRQLDTAKAQRAAAEQQMKLADRLLQLVEQSTTDSTNASELTRRLDDVVQRWSRLFVVATPKPLTPEQLAWSLWQATGQLPLDEVAVMAEWQQQHPAPANLDPTSRDERQSQLDVEGRRKMYERLSGAVNQFAQLFGGAAGQPQSDFHATADQALFLANGGTLLNLVAPREHNLTARLSQLDNRESLANELYLAVLQRKASPTERDAVQAYLTSRAEAREPALRELVWSLLTSAEFRFYR